MDAQGVAELESSLASMTVVTNSTRTPLSAFTESESVLNLIRRLLGPFALPLWALYDQHADQKLFTVRVWKVFRFTVYVHTCEPVIAMLIGAHP